MKNKTPKSVLWPCIVTLTIACTHSLSACNSTTNDPAPGVVDREQIRSEIQAKENEFAATYNSGIPKNIGYYADDATSFYQNRPALVGKDAIIEFLQSDIASNSNKITYKTEEVFVSNDGNQVVEIGYFQVVDSTNTTINKGNYMSLFEKRNGKYVSVRDMSVSDIVQ